MINHYVNLVCWKEIFSFHNSERDVIWVDSISLRFMLNTFGIECVYQPGTTAFVSYHRNKKTDNNWFYFSSQFEDLLPADKQYTLPNFSEISLTEDLVDILNLLPAGSNVAIGISAPKQNILALKMHEIRPDLIYYCFGAALGRNSLIKSGNIWWDSGSGFEWVYFLKNSPTRTIRKLIKTLKEMSLILIHKSTRKEFRKFGAICTKSVQWHREM